MNARSLSFSAVLITLLLTAPCLGQDLSKLRINEIQPTWGITDYVEIYNTGETAIELVPLVLRDRISGPGNERLFCMGRIEPHGYWVVECPYLLNSRGEEVALLDVDGNLIDGVKFPPFPMGHWDLSYGRVPDGGETWCFVLDDYSGPEPNLPESVYPKPLVVDARYSPIAPQLGVPVTVTVQLASSKPMSLVEVSCLSLVGPMQFLRAYDDGLHGDEAAGDGIYGAVIPPLPQETIVEYGFRVDGESLQDLNCGKYFFHYGYQRPGLRINEVLALNRKTGTWMPGSVAAFPDYIELYNAGAERVNLSQLMFRQSYSDFAEFTYQIFSNAGAGPLWVEPGQHLLVWASPEIFGLVPVGTGLSISYNGEDLLLVTADGMSVVDAVRVPPLEADVAYGRDPEGTGPFRILDEPTPQGGTVYPPGVLAYIGSAVATPGPGDEIPIRAWVSSDVDAPVGQVRYRFEGTEGSVPLFNDGAHGDDQPGDEIFCGTIPPLGKTGTLEVAVEVTDAAGHAQRDPYPADQWYSIPIGLAPVGKLVINEILASRFDEGGICPPVWDPSQPPQAELTKFVEIYNSGMSLEDVHFVITGSMFDYSHGLQFKRGHIADLGGVKAFPWDELDPRGGTLFLRGVETGTLYDAVTYPSLPAGKSYGRSPDGGPWVVLDEPSPGKLNGPFPFVRGDATADKDIDITDAISSLIYLFASGDTDCRDAIDVDDNGILEITDPIYSLRFLFLSGGPPPAPFPGAGSDDTPDELGCKRRTN